jgi:hypothetical protein
MTKDKKEDISKPVLAKPRSFLELLGISFPEKKDAKVDVTGVAGTGDTGDTPTQKEKLGELLKEDNEEFFIAQIEEYLKKKDSCTSDKN